MVFIFCVWMVVGLEGLCVLCFVVSVIQLLWCPITYTAYGLELCKMYSPASVEFRMECTYIRVKSKPYLFPRDDAGVLKRHMLCLGGGSWASGDLVEQLTLPLSFLPC